MGYSALSKPTVAAQITAFYDGNPLAEHRKHPLTPEMFLRWLELWGRTADALFEPEAAQALKDKAARIGDSLSLGLFFRPG